MSDIEKVDLKSMNIAEEKREKLKELFPEVFSEKKIDFDKLKSALGDIVETGRERYGMNWSGKADCLRVIQEPSVGTLKPCREESVDFDTTENLFIEGDNLEVLKLLQKSYYGKVKMIYIDPPYNTGKDFIYPDNYSESLDTYLKYTGQVDAEGRKYSTNADTDGRFHTRWINMMYPRLYLARNLLKEDGVIFISINDNEVVNLRKICDELFGEESFIAQIIWEKRITRENRRFFSVRHDYLLIYAKNSNLIADIVGLLPMDQAAIDRYKNPDNDPRGDWTSVPAIAQAGHGTKNQFYSLETPAGKIINPPSGSCWRYTKERMFEEISKNKIWFGKNGQGVPRIKKFLNEGRQGLTPETLWWAKDVDTNDVAKRNLTDLFDGVAVFETPKPIRFIERMLEIGTDKEGIVLDFFAGCCPSANAVMDINRKDNGTRNYIMVQLPELCAEDSEAFKAGYKTIADIGKERIRRVIKKIKEEEQPKLGTDLDKQDLGFKVLKLDSSNFRLWEGDKPEDEEALERQLELHINHIDPKSSTEDILYELLLKSGFKLTTKIEKLDLEGKEVFSIEDGTLLICLEEGLTKETVKAMADKVPAMVICLDRGFNNNDQLKTNTVQVMKSKKVEFKTV